MQDPLFFLSKYVVNKDFMYIELFGYFAAILTTVAFPTSTY